MSEERGIRGWGEKFDWLGIVLVLGVEELVVSGS
eukprot:gene14708-31277_t